MEKKVAKSKRKKTKMMRCSQVSQIRMLTTKILKPLKIHRSKTMTSLNSTNSTTNTRRKTQKLTWMVISRALCKPTLQIKIMLRLIKTTQVQALKLISELRCTPGDSTHQDAQVSRKWLSSFSGLQMED